MSEMKDDVKHDVLSPQAGGAGGGWGVIGFVQTHFKAIGYLNFRAHNPIQDQRQFFLFLFFLLVDHFRVWDLVRSWYTYMPY